MPNKKLDWFLVLLVVAAFTICANIYQRESRSNTTQSNISSVCGVSTETLLSDELNFGSGILLRDGIHVITNRHVVDRNKDMLVDDNEKSFSCTFFSAKGKKNTIHDSRVIWVAELQHFQNLMLDLAIIKLPEKVNGGVKLIDVKSYKNVAIGHPVYAVGCPGGKLPPHITFGAQSSQFQPTLGRAGISVWFGNSGGGIFSAQTGECLGIVSKLARDGNGRIIPEWTEYITVEKILPCLKELGIE